MLYFDSLIQYLDHYANLLLCLITLLLCLITAIYTIITGKILTKTDKQNALSIVLQLFEGIKNDYNGIEVRMGAGEGLQVKHGYNGFAMGFHLRNGNPYDALISTQPNECLDSFRFIITNYLCFLDKLNTLNPEDKKVLVPFVLSFYAERLKPFVDSLIDTQAQFNNQIKVEKVELFKLMKDKIKTLNTCR